MSDNITLEKLSSLINFQRKFRFLMKEVTTINRKLIFFKDILMSMVNNLSYCNNLKVFQNTDLYYISILEELKEIKDIIDKFPDYLTIKYLNRTGLNNVSLKLIKCELLISKYLNHIAPENLTYIFKLLFYDNWINYFEKDDIEKIIFISRFIRPICLWDSEKHKEKINVQNIEPLKKTTTITPNLIDKIICTKKFNNCEKTSSITIPDDSFNMPLFLKNITDIIEGSQKSQNKRNNHFTESECICVLEFDKIKITKNTHSESLVEDIYGCYVYISVSGRFLVLQGIFKDDLLNMSTSTKFVKDKINKRKITLDYNILTVPKIFKDNYFKILSLRDIIIYTSSELIDDVKKKYNDFKILQSKPLIALVNEFLLASKYRKIDILTLLLMSNDDDKKVACILFDAFKSKDKKDIASDIYQLLHYSIRDLLDNSKIKLEKEEIELTKLIDSDIPYERRINMTKTNDNVKAKAMDKLKSIKTSFQGDSKAQQWLDGYLKIPFGIYKENDILLFKDRFVKKIKLINQDIKLFSEHEINTYITELKIKDSNNDLITEWNKYKVDKKDYLLNVRKVLDEAVYGHKKAKLQLERLFAQWINGESKGAVLGLQGPPGIGKTSLAKNGLSKCLIDKEGKPRPFTFLAIGGSVNGSTLVGHNFTYVGSTWGCIVDMLMTSECMNPIIFIDEIDKVSHTEHGREIISILTHMTDSTQNDEFEDKFFAGIKINLSSALIIFSFNDPNLIDPILRDRITIIETNPLTISEKLTIIKDYMLPEICKEVGFNKDEIIFSDKLIKYLIETYTNEAGVRKIKEKIVEIVRDINLNRFYTDNFQIPYIISLDYINKLFESYPKIRIKKIPNEPSIGLVNGLYASSDCGLGGITLIQVIKFPSDKILELNLTGQAGDIMKESVQYALKNAFRLLSQEEQNKIIEDAQNKKTFGLHIHCPDGATPKDGPSAGLAFTLAIYSVLSGKKIRNDICMTGEIDLIGNAGIIGGLHAKLQGGKKAGCKIALIPNDNLDDLEKMRRDGTSPEDANFKVILISHINEILKYSLLSNINES